MSSDHPWADSESASTQSPHGPPSPKQQKSQPPGGASGGRGELRPLRLTKQRNRASIVSTSSTSSSGGATPTASSFTSPSRKSSLATEEFHCRPIRLGRNASVTEEKRDISEPSIARSPEKQQEAKRSLESTVSGPPIEGARQLIDSELSTNSSSSKRKSILIRNLPITSATTSRKSESKFDDMIFAICLVDFHHQRGPEIQWWKSNYHPDYEPDLFKNIPFQALPDGSHLFEETFSNFNLVYDFDQKKSIDNFNDVNNFKGDPRHLKTLFGCSERNKDITRSIVQKAIVIIVRKQPIFAKIKDKLSIIAKSYFQQETFSNFEVLENLFDNLNGQFRLMITKCTQIPTEIHDHIQEFAIGEEGAHLLKQQPRRPYAVPKNLISLMPNLINNLDDSGCPLIDYAETNGPLSKPQSLNTTSRASMLRFFGLPLQIFNTKNSFWNPYLPLQQLDELAVQGFMVGCSNLLFVNQANVYTPEDLNLSSMDKKFINHLINVDNHNAKHDDFVGSDDYIRYQFEDYLNSLISTMRYNQYSERFGQPPPGFNEASHINDFNAKFIESWRKPRTTRFGTPWRRPYSINKNISNFFNSFKGKGATATANSDDTIKVHKFIEEEPPKKIPLAAMRILKNSIRMPMWMSWLLDLRKLAHLKISRRITVPITSARDCPAGRQDGDLEQRNRVLYRYIPYITYPVTGNSAKAHHHCERTKKIVPENFQKLHDEILPNQPTMKHPYQILTSDKQGKYLFAVVKNYLQVFDLATGSKVANGKTPQRPTIRTCR
ncbi:Late secretory pathway protein AVL9 [Candida viswanathii]|uniref:Late secretory pathway protein AVL9 n=1 Tax=Candida viswanathii TaxID=5486 RepID=A0A367YHJ3_9ASCO|nr:Late secretory pathway protein AVL9 [Candida viswanathii]